jgi:hypothetical protein
MWWVFWLILFIAIVCSGVAVYIYTRPPPPPPPVSEKEIPSPDETIQGTCSFEGEDIYNQKIYDYYGKNVPIDTSIPCSRCNSYVFKDSDGCIPLGYDKRGGGGVCTSGFLNVSGNWGIPLSKKCPF